MNLSLYPALFSFLAGVSFGYAFEWMFNKRRMLLYIVVAAMSIWLIAMSIDAVFNPENLLRVVYSEGQGWVDFISGLAGYSYGIYLEQRHEQNKKYKIIFGIPRQATAYVHSERPVLHGYIKIVPEKYKEREGERGYAGLTQKGLSSFLKLPSDAQKLVMSTMMLSVHELGMFAEHLRNATVDELAAQMEVIANDIKNYKQQHVRVQLNETKLKLIQRRMEEINFRKRERDDELAD